MKAGVTAMLFAYTYLSRLKDLLGGKVSLTLASDKETGYERGTGYLFEQMELEILLPHGTNSAVLLFQRAIKKLELIGNITL